MTQASHIDPSFIALQEKVKELEKENSVLKEVQSRLKKSERNYQLLVDNQTDMLTKVDMEGRFLYVSPSYCTMFNKKENELLGQKHSPLIHEEDKKLTEDALSNTSQPPYTTYYQHRALTQDGWKWFSWHNNGIVNDAGKVTEIVSVGREINQFKHSEEERNRLQEQVGHSHKMDAVVRLASGIAHDYNNMLSVIIGHTEMALDDFSISSTLRLSLEQILSAAQRSSDITRQLLAFARKQPTAPTVINLNSIIDNIVPMATRLLGDDIKLIWSPAPDLWRIKTDPSHIDQIILNLCINARDAIKDTGTVVIKTSNSILDEESCSENRDAYPGEFISIVIQDTGIGIAKNTLNQIFEPFYTTKTSSEGAGLGLASVYGIVRQNKGFINVYSKLGEGTSFELYLPRFVATEGAESSSKPQTIPQGNGELILLVEDEIAILNLGRRLLETLGYVVVTANSPTEALSWVREHSTRIDLLLTDVVMPQMNGKEMAEKIQELYPHLKSKTLYMSGYASEVIVNRGLVAEEIQFIQKPFTKNGLATQINAVLRHND